MPKSDGNRLALFAKNSMANGIRAISGSFVSMILPLVLVAVLNKNNFAVWAVAFSVASYVLYLDLGIPTSLQALVARFERAGEPGSSARVARAGLSLVLVLSGACVGVGVVAGFLYRDVFPATPAALVRVAGATLVIALLGQLGSLISNVVGGYYAGLQRNGEPTAVIVAARLGSLVSASIGASLHVGLIVVALCYALPLIIGASVMMFRVWKEIRPAAAGSAENLPSSTRAALLRYSGPLIFWNICVLLISGAGLAIVGRLDYGAVAAYAVANVFAVGLSLLDGALIAALVPEFGRAHVDGDQAQLSKHVMRSSRLNSTFVLAVAAGVVTLSPIIANLLLDRAKLWLGVWLIIGLVLSAAIRAIPAPLSLAFVATGTHKRVIWPPLVETGVTVALSLWLGVEFGARGVVIGGVVGAVVGAALIFTISKRLSGAVESTSRLLVVSCFVYPVWPFVPLAGVIAVLFLFGGWDTGIGELCAILAYLLGVGLSWVAVGKGERTALRGIAQRFRLRKDGRQESVDLSTKVGT